MAAGWSHSSWVENMDSSASQKRQRSPDDADTVSTAGGCPKRPQYAQPVSYVEHATATGSGRMLNGHVHGDNIHGNVSTTINNFHQSPHGVSKTIEAPEPGGTLSKTERDNLLERLRFPQLDARLTNLRKAEGDTCDWIIRRNDYRQWVDSNELQACDGLFWIKGNPGTGKSITMKFLYQTMQRKLRNARTKDKLIISFFFNARGNEFEKSTLGLYRSLLFNLFNLAPNVQDALDQCQRGGYHNIVESGWQLQMLKEVFEEAVSLLQTQGKRVFCFVDALDECPVDDVQDMVSYFEDLVSRTDSKHFRVCFSSRHYPQVSIRTKLTITLEKEMEHDKDIKIFIKSQLRFEGDTDEKILQDIKDTVLEKSSGIFLWVNLVVHQLKEVYRQDGRMRAVKQRLENIPAAVLKQAAPNGAMPLYGLFQDIIHKDEKKVDELVRMAQIVFCARRPLRPKELFVLLHRQYDVPFDSSETSDKILEKHILEVSKGLAEITKSTDPTVQFIHETVREFLRDGGLRSISTQSIDCDGHKTLKESCLEQIHAPTAGHLELLAEYRLRGEFRNPRAHQLTKERQTEFLGQATEKFPFLEYASKNILFHAEEAEALGACQREFLQSFPTRIEEWISVYNLFEKFNTRRYNGKTTSMLYILADHGCKNLIQTSDTTSGQYIREIEGNEFRSVLACAIYNNHLDAAWALAGLEARRRPQTISAPTKTSRRTGESLIQLLLRLGDSELMKKVLEDCLAVEHSMPTKLDFEMVSSAELIDVFLEVSDVPGFPSVGDRHQQSQADQDALTSPQSHKDLKFIRRAIEVDSSLLKSKAWGEKTMFDYCIDQGLPSLLHLYLEYAGDDQPDWDAVLHHAAREGDLEKVKVAIRHNANLGSRNECGETALHLAAGDMRFSLGEVPAGARYRSMIRYLLSEGPSCINLRDYAGRTVLNRALLNWESRYLFFEPFKDVRLGSLSLFETFVQHGADVSIVLQCPRCPENGHLVPLVVFMTVVGESRGLREVIRKTACDLNVCDMFGRTALSWCLAYRPRHGHTFLYDFEVHSHLDCAVYLLQQEKVDVNSRDQSGHTILEHFIRQPLDPQEFPAELFFRSEQLDPNLQTSSGQHPLELIVALYNTWPDEFGDIGSEPELWSVGTELLNPAQDIRETRQLWLNQHLIKAGKLLLGTEKVDIDVQRRCEDRAPPELKRMMEQHRKRHDQGSRTVLTVVDLCN